MLCPSQWDCWHCVDSMFSSLASCVLQKASSQLLHTWISWYAAAELKGQFAGSWFYGQRDGVKRHIDCKLHSGLLQSHKSKALKCTHWTLQVNIPGYQECIKLVAEFTVASLKSWQWEEEPPILKSNVGSKSVLHIASEFDTQVWFMDWTRIQKFKSQTQTTQTLRCMLTDSYVTILST